MKKNKLIADAGSTKIDWVVLSPEGKVLKSVSSSGLNPLLSSSSDVEDALLSMKKEFLDSGSYSEIHYYGAGCATPEICDKMRDALAGVWDSPSINVSSDLLGAARALFNEKKGIACILGTGSNSCLYDGKEIVVNVPSLGYVLGDEGSGAALGKRLLSDAFKGHLPVSLRDKFLESSGLTLPQILDKIYRTGSPNRFLASLVPFISENIWNPYLYSLVLEELTSFVRRNISRYPGAHSLEVSFIGSIASGFEKILREAVASQGYRVSRIEKSPLEGLITYHSSSNS